MIYGYARISTKTQSIERQIRNIKTEYPEAIIFQEAYSGTTEARPQWQRLLRRVKSGDTIVFDSVSRMSRNADEGFKTYRKLYEAGVELIYLKEHHIDTATYKRALTSGVPLTGTSVDLILSGVNQYLLKLAEDQIRLAFEQAQKEVDDLHQRTKEGIETARQSGKQIGRPRGSGAPTDKAERAKQKILRRSKAFGGDCTDIELAAICGISRQTVSKYRRQLEAEADLMGAQITFEGIGETVSEAEKREGARQLYSSESTWRT